MNLDRKKLVLIMAGALIVPAFMWQQIDLWNKNAHATDNSTPSATDANTTTTPAVDQAAVDNTKSDISDLQKKINKAQAAKNKLVQNLGQIQSAVASTQQQINQTQNVIKQTTDSLSQKEQEIQSLNDKIDLQRELLKSFLQQTYYIQNQPALNVVLAEGDFAQLFSGADHYATLDDKILQAISDIRDSQAQIEQDKAVLADMQQQHEQILASTVDQKQTLVANQNDVQDQIQKQDATISELQSKLSKLQSDLSSLLGISVSSDDIKTAAQQASNATGVRASFILGELMQESGMGRYTGGCTYKNTRVQPAQASAFKQIMNGLGYDINSKKISCAGSVGYGGAMGIAQFMPTTWLGWQSKISAATGHNPPDPWSPRDGVTGMALKLKADGADSKKGEYNASMLYYCGTTHPATSAIKAACNNYAADVQSLASGYENND